MRYRTISDAALDLCAFHLGDPEGAKQAIALRALRMAMDTLSLHVSANIISVQKTITDAYTIAMPTDCMDVLKVGVVLDGGRVRLMGRDDSIRRDVPAAAGCTCTESSDTATVSECPACCLHNVWWGDAYYGEMYGFRPPQFPNGKFRYNDKLNRIEFSSGYDVVAGDTVLIEYSAAYGPNEYNLIPAPYMEALLHKAAATLLRGGEAEMHERAFQRAHSAYKRATNPYNEFDITAALRGEMMSAPKQ